MHFSDTHNLLLSVLVWWEQVDGLHLPKVNVVAEQEDEEQEQEEHAEQEGEEEHLSGPYVSYAFDSFFAEHFCMSQCSESSSVF